jgi:hypothetical protein
MRFSCRDPGDNCKKNCGLWRNKGRAGEWQHALRYDERLQAAGAQAASSMKRSSIRTPVADGRGGRVLA